jgi:hypothetical protein
MTHAGDSTPVMRFSWLCQQRIANLDSDRSGGLYRRSPKHQHFASDRLLRTINLHLTPPFGWPFCWSKCGIAIADPGYYPVLKGKPMRYAALLCCLLFAVDASHGQTPQANKPTASATVVPIQKLPSQKEAEQKATYDAQHGGVQGILHQHTLIDDAVHEARAAEVKAIKSGHPELVAPEDINDCQRAMASMTKREPKWRRLRRIAISPKPSWLRITVMILTSTLVPPKFV